MQGPQAIIWLGSPLREGEGAKADGSQLGLFPVPTPAAIRDRNLPVWSALQLAFRVQLSGSCLTPVGVGASSVSGPTWAQRRPGWGSSGFKAWGQPLTQCPGDQVAFLGDRKSTRLNSSH